MYRVLLTINGVPTHNFSGYRHWMHDYDGPQEKGLGKSKCLIWRYNIWTINYKKKNTQKKPIVNIVIIYCCFVLFMFVYILTSGITNKNSLFLRWAYVMNVIQEKHHVHYFCFFYQILTAFNKLRILLIGYLRLDFNHCVDIFDGELVIPQGIIRPVVSASEI